MRPVFLIARREIGAYLNTAWGWVILAIALLFDGLLFNAVAMSDKPRFSADVLEDFMMITYGVTVAAGLLLTMRLFAEERQTGTLVVLETAPVTETQVVLGKFLGAYGFLCLIVALSAYIPALIFVNGKVSWGHIGAGYLGVLAVGAATVAIGTYGSALTRYQIVAGFIGLAIWFLLLVSWYISRVSDPPISELASYVAFFERHFQPFQRGRINTESLVYYGSLVFLFLTLSVRTLQARRWQ